MATKKTKTKKAVAKKPKVKLTYKSEANASTCGTAGSELHAKEPHKKSIAGTVLGKCSGKSRATKSKAKAKRLKELHKMAEKY
jgi:hypothetical protein